MRTESMPEDSHLSLFSSQHYYMGEPVEEFTPYKKNIILYLKLDQDDIAKYSLGGFIIGVGGAKVKAFTSQINNKYPMATNNSQSPSQFLRLRLLGRL